MFFPWHALSILGLQLALRLYQLAHLSREHALPAAVWAQLPWLLWPDLVFAVAAGLVWDWGEAAIRARVLNARRRTWLFGAAFVGLVGYLGFSCRFYAQFEDFFNYGFWTQVDRLSSFWKPIWQELGPGSFAGVTGLFLFSLAVRWAAHNWPRWGQNRPRLQQAGFLLALVWFLGFSPWGHAFPAANWRALDKNPLLELASFFQPEPIARMVRMLPGPAGNLTHLAFVRTLPPSQRQNFSVLLIIMESTHAGYVDLTRSATPGLTPNLARLAASSVVFSNHYCQEPATLKSWYTLLTGRYYYATRRW